MDALNKDEPWKSCIEKSKYLEGNFKSNYHSISRRTGIFGFGINDATYMTQPKIDGSQVTCPAYKSWKDMIRRCYDDKFHIKNRTYIGVTVCEEWRSFMAFREWWLENHVDGYELDKDLTIIGNMVYSPKCCTYVSKLINSIMSDCAASRGNLPIGVSKASRGEKFEARVHDPIKKRLVHLGTYDDSVSAGRSWVAAKIKIVESVMDKIPNDNIYKNMIEIIKSKAP